MKTGNLLEISSFGVFLSQSILGSIHNEGLSSDLYIKSGRVKNLYYVNIFIN